MKLIDKFKKIFEFVKGLNPVTYDEFKQIAKLFYEELGWITVPMSLEYNPGSGKFEKRPLVRWGEALKITGWKELEKIWNKVRESPKLNAIGLVCGKKSKVTVIDIDNLEKFEKLTGLKLKNVITKTLVQRSISGGFHLFFEYDPTIKTKTYPDYGFDVKNDGGLITIFPSYVVIPSKEKNEERPSKNPKLLKLEELLGEGKDIEVRRYEFVNISELMEIPKTLKKLLDKKQSGWEKEERDIERDFAGKVIRAEEFAEIVPAIRELYLKGYLNGWEDIDASLVGALVQFGFSDEQIHEVLEEIYEEQYDEKLTQYVIDRAKYSSNIRGLGSFIYKLRQILDYETDEDIRNSVKKILDVIYRQKDNEIVEGFKVLNDRIYKRTRNGLKPVGPFVKILAKIEEKEGNRKKTFYELQYRNETFIVNISDDREFKKEIQAQTGEFIHSLKDFKIFFDEYKRKINIPIKYIRRKTGWYKKKFKYPLKSASSDIWDISHYDKFVLLGDGKKHKEFIGKVLKSGSDLGLIILASLSSPLLYPLRLNPYLVHISGLAGTGKTTAGKIATGIFYDGRDTITLFGTRNALELTLSEFCDLPVLLDEEELSRDKELIVNLAYLLFSGRGKSRATVTLDVKQREIRSVVFTTSEHSLEDTLNFLSGKSPVRKIGALRRTLHIHITDRDEFYKGLDFKEILQAVRSFAGHFGLEWITFIENNPEKVEEAYEKATAERLPVGSEHIFLALWTAYHLLKEFLEDDLKELREVILRYIENQEGLLNKETDIIKRFAEEFTAWVVSHAEHFIGAGFDAKSVKEPIFGKTESGFAYVISTYFREFCSEKGFSLRTLLEHLDRAGILLRGQKGKRFMKSINGRMVSTYAIDLQKLETIAGFVENEADSETETIRKLSTELLNETGEVDLDVKAYYDIDTAVKEIKEDNALKATLLERWIALKDSVEPCDGVIKAVADGQKTLSDAVSECGEKLKKEEIPETEDIKTLLKVADELLAISGSIDYGGEKLTTLEDIKRISGRNYGDRKGLEITLLTEYIRLRHLAELKNYKDIIERLQYGQIGFSEAVKEVDKRVEDELEGLEDIF
jgi:hypothetical protein